MSKEEKSSGVVALDSDLVRNARGLLKKHPEGISGQDLALTLFKMKTVPEVLARKMLKELLGSDPHFDYENGRWFFKHTSFSWEEPLASALFLVLDVEMIGRGRSAKIVELAGFKLKGGKIEGEFHTLVNPERPLAPAWWSAPRFSDEELQSAPTIGPVLNRFFQFAGEAIWVAHNARFDLRVLNLELRRFSYFQISRPVLDTLPLVRRYFPGLDNHNLPQLANYFGVELEEHHRARADALALSQIFLKILHYLKNEGHTNLSILKPFALPNLWEELGKD